jgi:hypothetical protein
VTTRRDIIAAVRAEFQRHKMDVFVDNPPSIAQGGKGVVVPGCSVCKVRLNTTEQFMEHVEQKVCALIATV